MASVVRVPLFPLNTVLFPGGPLPLRIFEPRYLDMISRCLKADAPFGVVLIRDGAEAGLATTHTVGTLARVTDWYQGSDGILGVTAVGEQRFRLLAAERQRDGLNVGEVELLPDAASFPLPTEYQGTVSILANVMDELGILYEGIDRRYDDTAWVAYRLAEILPIGLDIKQECLESEDLLNCLRAVERMIQT